MHMRVLKSCLDEIAYGCTLRGHLFCIYDSALFVACIVSCREVGQGSARARVCVWGGGGGGEGDEWMEVGRGVIAVKRTTKLTL